MLDVDGDYFKLKIEIRDKSINFQLKKKKHLESIAKLVAVDFPSL